MNNKDLNLLLKKEGWSKIKTSIIKKIRKAPNEEKALEIYNISVSIEFLMLGLQKKTRF